MTDRPILFQGAMVRALLDGSKSQTRRIVKMRKDRDLGCELAPREIAGEINAGNYRNCPYGAPGDWLWVRETTRMCYVPDIITGEPTGSEAGEYAADAEPVLDRARFDFVWWYSRPVCPSIHMPRFASRITLEITGIRVEKLQDISADDADAECFGGDFPGKALPELFPGTADQWSHLSMPECYARLWESINGAGSWALNPWVYVLEFKRV